METNQSHRVRAILINITPLEGSPYSLLVREAKVGAASELYAAWLQISATSNLARPDAAFLFREKCKLQIAGTTTA